MDTRPRKYSMGVKSLRESHLSWLVDTTKKVIPSSCEKNEALLGGSVNKKFRD
jgi:hypothetical protein